MITLTLLVVLLVAGAVNALDLSSVKAGADRAEIYKKFKGEVKSHADLNELVAALEGVAAKEGSIAVRDLGSDIGCEEDPVTGGLVCCATIARLQQAVCARLQYDMVTKELDVAVNVAGFQVFHKEFFNWTHGYCHEFFTGMLCVNITNESFAAKGVCGCLEASLDLGGFPLPIQIGCFAIGDHCYSTNCQDYDKCDQCTILQSCGWCQGSSMCMQQSGMCSGALVSEKNQC